MSTRALIGYKIPGSEHIVSIYSHWDGYPSYLGKRLLENYSTDETVRGLIDLGDISIIDSDKDWEGKKFPKPQPLTYASRGDRDAAPTVSESLKEYCEEGNSCYAEYVYIYDDGFWSCYTCPDCVLTNI